MINPLREEKIRKMIIQGKSNMEIVERTSTTLSTVKKIRKILSLVLLVDSQLREQIIAKLCGGYTHKEIAETAKVDMETVLSINRFYYLRSKKKMARVPIPLCLLCKADIDALNDKPCFNIDIATNGNIEFEARPMFEVICNIVGLDSLCIIASPIFGAIAKEAGQIRKRVIGEKDEKSKTETK